MSSARIRTRALRTARLGAPRKLQRLRVRCHLERRHFRRRQNQHQLRLHNWLISICRRPPAAGAMANGWHVMEQQEVALHFGGMVGRLDFC